MYLSCQNLKYVYILYLIVKIYVYEIIENLGINKSIKGSLKHYRKKNFQYGFETAGLEPVLSHTEKACIASYYRQKSTNVKIKITKSKTVFRAYQTCFNLKTFHFDIRGNQSII